MKSKRKKTLLKKVIEFARMFNLDVFMVIQDTEMNKVMEYNSGSTSENTLFTMAQATKALQQAYMKTKIHKYITDDNYKKYVHKNGDDETVPLVFD